MTEEEAKTKLCCGPQDCGERMFEDRPIPLNPNALYMSKYLGRYCKGSECMAWRWNVVKVITETELGKDMPKSREETVAKEFGGYCGLAGKP